VSENERADPVRAAVRLIRAARAGTLATVSEGQPFASLVTPAAAADGALLMLLSGLSPHTRHLRQEPRCSVLLVAATPEPNPQTAPRISLVGTAAPAPDPALKARWVALHPYAAFYADLGDFQLWRFAAQSGQYVGGFASAHRFAAAELAPNAESVAAIASAEAAILGHCNADHADAMDAIAHAHGGNGSGWRMVACDMEGCDLALDEIVLRVAWAAPAGGPGDVRQALIRLATAARNPVAPGSAPRL
jgi:hypothetical protein